MGKWLERLKTFQFPTNKQLTKPTEAPSVGFVSAQPEGKKRKFSARSSFIVGPKWIVVLPDVERDGWYIARYAGTVTPQGRGQTQYAALDDLGRSQNHNTNDEAQDGLGDT